MVPIFILSLISVVLVFAHRRWRTYLLRQVSLPPGPPALPLVGNLFNKPIHHEWITYASWAKKYGDIMYMDVLGTPTIVLNSLDAATELLEKRSGNYADRPRMVMADELMGWQWNFGHMGYSDRWRRHRKTFHQYFQSRSVPTYRPVLQEAAIGLLGRLVDSPDHFRKHIRQYTGSIILRLTYGYDVRSENDHYVNLVGRAIGPVLLTIHAGAFLVDYLPFLKHIPAWFPGASFQRDAKKWTEDSMELINGPFDGVKRALQNGTAVSSFVSQGLENLTASQAFHLKDVEIESTDENHEESPEVVIKNAAGVAYSAGTDTSLSVISTFVAIMASHPHIQARAQVELDSVLGNPDGANWRLPTLDDRADLPYINALLLELLRWNPPAPLALPHKALTDDFYQGYFIPAGATVIPNTWAIMHDTTLYPDPFKFDPERFLHDKDGVNGQLPPDPTGMIAFGFGRRICPGRYLAVETIWIAIASILATFNIGGEANVAGDLKFTSGLVSHPEDFKARFIPRTKTVVTTVKASMLDAALEVEHR